MLAIGWEGNLGTAKVCIKKFCCRTVFDPNLVDPIFHCLKKSSVLGCHLWLQKYFIQSPLWCQRPKSDFNISPTAEAFLPHCLPWSNC